MSNIRILCPNILRCVWFYFTCRLSMQIYFTSYSTRIPSPTQVGGMTYVQRQQISLSNWDTLLAIFNQNSSGLKFQITCCHFSVCQRNERIFILLSQWHRWVGHRLVQGTSFQACFYLWPWERFYQTDLSMSSITCPAWCPSQRAFSQIDPSDTMNFGEYYILFKTLVKSNLPLMLALVKLWLQLKASCCNISC